MIAGILGIAGIAAIAALLPHVFRRMPSELVGDTQIALLLVGSSLAVGLPASIFNGIFVGLQRNEVPAATIGGSRLVAAVLQVLIVRHGGSLTQLGLALAGVNLASYGLQYLMYRKVVPALRFSSQLVSRGAIRELFDYCLSLTVWSFAMLLISGLDLTLVGVFQFDAVAYYAVAVTLVTLISGSQTAIFNALLSPTAVLHARGDSSGLGRLLVSATRYGTFLLLLTGLPLIFWGGQILAVWVGPIYSASGVKFLQILVAANIIRLSAVPYAITLIGTGQQRLVIFTPLFEGVTNLFASLVGGLLYGAIGVAYGTLVGAVFGIAGNLVYNMPRTKEFDFHIVEYLKDGLLRPVACALPLIVCTLLLRSHQPALRVARYAGFLVAVLVTLWVIWQYGLVASERDKLRSWRLAPEV